MIPSKLLLSCFIWASDIIYLKVGWDILGGVSARDRVELQAPTIDSLGDAGLRGGLCGVDLWAFLW